MSQQQPPLIEFPLAQPNAYPLGIAVDSQGHVWFAEANTDLLVEFFPSNQSYESFQIPTEPHLAMVWFLVFDRNGNLWFADPVQPLLWKFTPSKDVFANFTTEDQNLKPYGLAYDSSSNQIWFTSVYSNQLGAFQIDSNGNAQVIAAVTLPTVGNGNTGPSGITLGTNGKLYVSESFAGRIVEYDPSTGSFGHVWNLPGGSQPVGIGVAKNGMIWFANHASSLIGYVNITNGQVTEIATSLFQETVGSQISTTISLPYWLTISTSGQVWFDEHYANRIARFDPNTYELVEFQVPTNGSQPLRFHISETNQQLWFTEFAGNKLGQIDVNASLGQTLASPRSIVLSQGKSSFVVNLPLSQISTASFSGSLSYDGFLTSNLSISYSSLNSSATKVEISKGQNVIPGNYTLTVCPVNAESSHYKSCTVLALSVEGRGNSSGVAIYLGIATTLLGATLVSIIYFRKRRR